MKDPSMHKPDFTAWFVLQGIIATMQHPRYKHYKDEKSLVLYKVLSDAASITRGITRLSASLPYKLQHIIMEFVTNAGRLEFFCFRKKEIEKNARKIIEEKGIKNVVILGAGLDVLSMKLAQEYSDIKFIEIDQKESIHFKTEAFIKSNITIPNNIELVGGDLKNPLSDILSNSKLHNPRAKTLWIAEGFLMFIPEESVLRIFKEIKEISASGSHVIFTTIPEEYPGSAIGQWLQKYFMKKENCEYAWTIPLDKSKNFILKQGFNLIDRISYESLYNGNTNQEKLSNKRLTEDIHIAET